MGDAKDAGVFILFFPGILFPLIFLFKWVAVKIYLKGGTPTPLGRVAIASLLESATPTLSLFTLPAFGALNLMETRWLRIGSFLIVICISNCIVSYVVFKGADRSMVHPMRAGVIILLGIISAVLFPTCWMLLGQLLIRYG
jgi:hypothetical protein